MKLSEKFPLYSDEYNQEFEKITNNFLVKIKRTKSGFWRILGKRFRNHHFAVKYYLNINGVD